MRKSTIGNNSQATPDVNEKEDRKKSISIPTKSLNKTL